MSASGGCECGCGSCGARARATRRRPDYGRQTYRGGTEHMVARPPAPPQFGGRMSFAAALARADANSVGLYRIYKNGRHLYSGRATPGTIRNRLIQHRWCLTHMGVDPAPYTVTIAPMPGSSPARVIAAEKAEIRRQRQSPTFSGTNRREGEAMFGLPSWARVRDWARSQTGYGRTVGDVWRRLSSSAPSMRSPGAQPPPSRPPSIPPPPPTLRTGASPPQSPPSSRPPASSQDNIPIPLTRRLPPRDPDAPPPTWRSRYM